MGGVKRKKDKGRKDTGTEGRGDALPMLPSFFSVCRWVCTVWGCNTHPSKCFSWLYVLLTLRP